MTAVASRRAIISTADLRRIARVARDEGVAFDCRIDPTGSLAFSIQPLSAANSATKGDDLDARLAEFARK